MNKILVTGGMGYIGSHAIIEIIRDGRFVPISADSCVNSTEETKDHIFSVTGQRVTNYLVDLCNVEDTFRIFEENPDIVGVIHFAALKSVPNSVQEPLLYYRNNLNSLANLLEACQKYGVNNFIFSSSCSIYGNVKTLPVDETTPFGVAASPYAYTKQIGEVMLQDFSKICPTLKSIALRYFNPVGADHTGRNGENPSNPPTALVPYITQTAVGVFSKLIIYGSDYDTRDGSCVRDYIHVTEIAQAHLLALDYLLQSKNEEAYEVFNLGSGNGVTVFEAVKAFIDETGVDLPYEVGPRRPGDVGAIYSNSDKAHQKLGWKPKMGISEMMRSAWAWQQYLASKKVPS